MAKILFGNNISNMGKFVTQNFKFFDFDITYCSNNYNAIMDSLEKDKYEALFFFIMNRRENYYSLVEDVRKMYPDMRIYPLIYKNTQKSNEDFECKGNVKCFDVPDFVNKLCFYILNDFFDESQINISIDIAKILAGMDIPSYIKGFYYLCEAMDIINDNPDAITNLSQKLYPAIKERTGAPSIAWIERSIRILSHRAFKDDVQFDYYPNDRNLMNKIFIKAVYDEYRKRANKNKNDKDNKKDK